MHVARSPHILTGCHPVCTIPELQECCSSLCEAPWVIQICAVGSRLVTWLGCWGLRCKPESWRAACVRHAGWIGSLLLALAATMTSLWWPDVVSNPNRSAVARQVDTEHLTSAHDLEMHRRGVRWHAVSNQSVTKIEAHRLCPSMLEGDLPGLHRTKLHQFVAASNEERASWIRRCRCRRPWWGTAQIISACGLLEHAACNFFWVASSDRLFPLACCFHE